MPQIEENPFAPLAAYTPTGLNITRKAEMDERLGKGDYWARAMGTAGLDIRQELLSQGIGMNAEDRKALGVQRVMEESQKGQSEAIKKGADPLDAQEMAVMDAMQSFMTLGNFEAAQSLAPQLAKLREYRGELAKLKSETGENEATANKANVDAKIAILKAQLDVEKNPWEIKKLQAEINKLNREPVAKQKGSDIAAELGIYDPKDFGIPNSDHFANQMAVGATLNMFEAMERLSQMYDDPETAAAASVPGQALNRAGQMLTGAVNTIRRLNGGGAPTTYMQETTKEGNSVSTLIENARPEFQRRADTLGMDVTVYESLVIDAAYALARAADPGGRLSNNDFDLALKQLGAVQDPASAQQAFANLAERGYSNLKNRFRGMDERVVKLLYGQQMINIDNAYGKFATRRGLGGTPSASTQARFPENNKAPGQRRPLGKLFPERTAPQK